jgi:hypothetical protein
MNSNESKDTEQKGQPEGTEAAGTKLSDLKGSADYADKADTGHSVERQSGEAQSGAGASPDPEDRDRNV